MKQNIYDDSDFAKGYDNIRKEGKGTNANDLIEIPNFRKMVPDVKGKKILDLGCGYGENDKYYKEKGAEYVLGIDISKHMIDEANKENKVDGVEFKVLPMEDISTLGKTFDMVISSLAFHYIKDFDKLVKDIYDILNDGGYLIFSQEHPNITSFKPTENMPKGHIEVDGKYYGVFSDYNRLGERELNWFDKKVLKYHRNFEYIINTLVNTGFTIEEVNEPVPSEEGIKINPKYNNQFDRPYFLIIKVRK